LRSRVRSRSCWIRFRRGRTYVYFDVPPSAYAALLEAPSKGRYLNFEIKPYHEYRRV
jgi:KTSC domain